MEGLFVMNKRIMSVIIAIFVLLSVGVPVVASEPGSDAPLTRAAFVLTLFQALGEPMSAGPNIFSDVPDDAPYAKAVSWAAQNGVVNGMGDGKFAPEKTINREQTATVFLNYAKSVGAGPVGSWAIYLDYEDIGDISDWALEGVMYSKIRGWIPENSDTLFDPKGTVTHEEASGWINRLTLPPVEGDSIVAADYADANNWAIITQNPDKPADVFLLYPTVYPGGSRIAGIDDKGMRDGAEGWFAGQGSAFETAGNVFMPYYRQLNATWLLGLPVEEQPAYVKGVPKTDILAAFEYYLENFNNGRPFIIASHSQGTSMAMEIVFDYFVRNPEPAERMVAAYLIGYSITQNDLALNPNMKFAESADDTGVIVSYNTVAPDVELAAGGVLQPGAIAINPISWTRTDNPAPASANPGSYLDVGNGLERIMELCDATLDTKLGAVICSSVDKDQFGLPGFMEASLGKGSYHPYDISFYYFSLRENAENRVNNYIQANSR